MNLKLHIAAVSIIFLLLLAVTQWTKKREAAEESTGPLYLIQVSSASIGLNCLDKKGNIAREYAVETAEPIYKEEKTALLRPNNALKMVTDLCNKKSKCEFRVSPLDFGIDIIPRCIKQLVVDYRCFSYDRLHSVKALDGNKLAIDCTPSK